MKEKICMKMSVEKDRNWTNNRVKKKERKRSPGNK